MADEEAAVSRKTKRASPGQRARAIRAERGLTIKQIAVRSKLGVGAVCDFENGKRVLRTDSLVKLAGALGVQPSALLDA
jgi:transcriptional regulator with XRE-family HTH domain